MNAIELGYVALEYGTPLFVFDEGAFAQRMRNVGEIFGADVQLCFAVKANPFFISTAERADARLEVCSPGELDICRALNVNPTSIVFSGVNKTPDTVHDAADYGVGIDGCGVMTAESRKHVELIEAEGEQRGASIDVLLRLNAGSQFGMSRDDLLDIIDSRARFPHVRIVGIHYFKGTQRLKLKHQIKELGKLTELIDEIENEHGFAIERLEYGPGLGVPQFTDDDFSDTLAPARELTSALQDIAARVELTVEMGRFFAAECGTYLTTVNDLKACDPMRYCIVDGGINHLTYLGSMMGMKTPVVEHLRDGHPLDANAANGCEPLEWCIAGSLCTTNDVLVRNIELADLREGDVLAFRNAGAYAVTEGIALLLSRTLPRVIMRKEDGMFALGRDFTETSPLNTLSM